MNNDTKISYQEGNRAKAFFETKFNSSCEQVIISKESAEYKACSFVANKNVVQFRKAKITPKKVGQFVAIWTRADSGETRPYDISDTVEYLVIYVENNSNLGLFIFPGSFLIKSGIFSSETTKGKRGIRVYPPWDQTINRQAKSTQQSQLKYFHSLTS